MTPTLPADASVVVGPDLLLADLPDGSFWLYRLTQDEKDALECLMKMEEEEREAQ